MYSVCNIQRSVGKYFNLNCVAWELFTKAEFLQIILSVDESIKLLFWQRWKEKTLRANDEVMII